MDIVIGCPARVVGITVFAKLTACWHDVIAASGQRRLQAGPRL